MTTAPELPTAPDLSDPGLYINRELSWLDFNERVLALAREPQVPLLERCKFLAIFSSNLDEFFMVRVAAVQDALEAGRRPSTPDQLPREEVLDRIADRVRELTAEQSRIWHEEIVPALGEAGIEMVSFTDLGPADRREVDEQFDREVYPVLTPLAVGPGLPFPYISGLSLNLGLRVRDPVKGETRFARIKVPPRLPRFLPVDERRWVRLEDVIRCHVERLFPGMEVLDTSLFRVTRDADFSISDESDDLLGAVEAQLRRRRFGHVVRLEVEQDAPEGLVEDLIEALEVGERDTFRVEPPLDFTSLWMLATMDRPELRDPPWEPRTRPRLRPEEGEKLDIFAAIRAGDILVHHPYDDFHTSVERFVEQAVEDPNVLAIKQTVYRTSGDSPIVPALMRAAEQGKQTVCLVEVQARFDEERNIQWARALERSGVHVVYGLSGLKTHAKLALVVRREGDRVRRYVHFGTGNYNPSTARLYTDLGVFTCREDVAEDVADLFNHLTGFARPPMYRRALVAPARPAPGRHPRDRARHRRALRGLAVARRAQAQLDHRRADHPGDLPRLAGRGPGGHDRARHHRPAPRHPRHQRQRPRDLDRRPVPRARAHLRLHRGRRDQLPHRLGRHDGPQPRQPRRAGGADRRPPGARRDPGDPRPAARRHRARVGARRGRPVAARRPGPRPGAAQLAGRPHGAGRPSGPGGLTGVRHLPEASGIVDP